MNYNDLLKNENSSSLFIAEAGINHDGSLLLAKKLIDQAKISGCDSIKFQSFLKNPNSLKIIKLSFFKKI